MPTKRKAQFILSISLLLTVIAGLLAFKANIRCISIIYYKTAPVSTALCTYIISNRTLNAPGQLPLSSTYATTLPFTTCTLLPVYTCL